MKTPLILINLKTYDSVDGNKAVKLAKICQGIARQKKVSIALAVDALDVKTVAKSVKIPIFAEHVDDVDYGAHTGWIVPQALKNAGIVGTLLNHAEHQLSFKEIAARIKKCKQIGLITCICANTPQTAKKLLTLQPDFIAYEPPELIGGDISVSTAKPQVLKKIAHMFKGKKTKVLCGAGVKTAQDVRIAVRVGMHGVLLASGVTKAANPKKAVEELVSGIKAR